MNEGIQTQLEHTWTVALVLKKVWNFSKIRARRPGITLDPQKKSDHRVRRNSILRLEKSQEMKNKRDSMAAHTDPKSSLPKHGCAAAQFFDFKARDHFHKMCQNRRANA